MLKSLIPVIIEIASQFCDAVIKGENVGTDGIKAIQTGYVAAKIWLTDVVADSVNTYDDAALDAFLKLCEDTAQEGNFSLPSIP